jgi:hypothetical protein
METLGALETETVNDDPDHPLSVSPALGATMEMD